MRLQIVGNLDEKKTIDLIITAETAIEGYELALIAEKLQTYNVKYLENSKATCGPLLAIALVKR